MIAALTALALAAAPSLARLPVAGGGEVTVSARQFKYIVQKQRLEYTGDPVRLTRGDASLACKQLVAQLDKGGEVDEATCQGDVRFERADKVVTCEKAVYQAAASRLTCHGKPTLRSGTLTATGTLLVYDFAADEVTMDDPTGVVPAGVVDPAVKRFQDRKKQGRGGQR